MPEAAKTTLQWFYCRHSLVEIDKKNPRPNLRLPGDCGAPRENRTLKTLRSVDFESTASTGSAIGAREQDLK